MPGRWSNRPSANNERNELIFWEILNGASAAAVGEKFHLSEYAAKLACRSWVKHKLSQLMPDVCARNGDGIISVLDLRKYRSKIIGAYERAGRPIPDTSLPLAWRREKNPITLEHEQMFRACCFGMPEKEVAALFNTERVLLRRKIFHYCEERLKEKHRKWYDLIIEHHSLSLVRLRQHGAQILAVLEKEIDEPEKPKAKFIPRQPPININSQNSQTSRIQSETNSGTGIPEINSINL